MIFLNRFFYLLLTFHFFFSFSSTASVDCHKVFKTDSQPDIFEIMNHNNHDYVQFSLNTKGELQTEYLPLGEQARTSNVTARDLQSDSEIYKSSFIPNVLKEYGHEALHFIQNNLTGLKSIVAVHNGALGSGTALGGTRIWKYETEIEGLIDVFRLSEGMTYKAAMARFECWWW